MSGAASTFKKVITFSPILEGFKAMNNQTTPSTPATIQPQKPIAPSPELAAPTAADLEAQRAAEEALKKAQKNRGRANTILSGSLLPGTVGEDTSAKRLLGG